MMFHSGISVTILLFLYYTVLVNAIQQTKIGDLFTSGMHDV